MYNISSSTTEPHHPHQNKSEREVQTVKESVRRILDRSGAPDRLWLRATEYVCMLGNLLAREGIGWRTPTEVAFGVTPDLSPFLSFHFYQEVLYFDDDGGFPS